MIWTANQLLYHLFHHTFFHTVTSLVSNFFFFFLHWLANSYVLCWYPCLFFFECNVTVMFLDSATMQQLTRCVGPAWPKSSDSASARKNTSALGALQICLWKYLSPSALFLDATFSSNSFLRVTSVITLHAHTKHAARVHIQSCF
jgi:hypothetical protein